MAKPYDEKTICSTFSEWTQPNSNCLQGVSKKGENLKMFSKCGPPNKRIAFAYPLAFELNFLKHPNFFNFEWILEKL